MRIFYFNTTLVVCSCFDECWSFGVAALGWYPCSRLNHSFSLLRVRVEVRSSTTSPLLISCFPPPCSSSSRTSVVVVMPSCGCRSRGRHSTVTFVSPYIYSTLSIESTMPSLPSTNGAFASFRTSLRPTAPCSGSSLCSDATPVECVLSSCFASPFSACCSST